ncbi:MAG TPA: methionine adenosyltransferase, partial [Gemmatimonadetes bacterium]|nr:methionine adenosyltransferase [Gemmatimonadota bacterium]
MSRRLFTSESVTEGHPDKIADQVSDSVLDHILAGDPNSRVACETLVTTDLAVVAGEITTGTYADIPGVVRSTLRRIGYTDSSYGIDADTCEVVSRLDQQSANIAMGLDGGGAGDQGMMFGYATDETAELMPAPIQFAHRITRRLAEVRRSGELDFLRPDGKSQVTVEYEGDRLVRVHTVVVSAQHSPAVTQQRIHDEVREVVVKPVLPPELLEANDCIVHINPTGLFEIGGPHGDAGLTGRKII